MYYLIYYLPFYINALELIAIIIGFVHYHKYKHTLLKYFLWFLCYGFLSEMIGFLVSYVFKQNNVIIFNIYTLVQYEFFLWLFYKHFKTVQYKILTKSIGLFTGFSFIINSIFFQDIFTTFQSYSLLLGGFFLIITIILFFTELLNSDVILMVKNLLIFWVAVGILLFQLGLIPVFIATKYINYSNGNTYGYILLILNFITSLCYSLGFIWTKKNLNY